MFKIACAVAASAVVACLITLPNRVPQIDASSSTRVAKSERADAGFARTCSHNFSVVSSLGSSDENCKGQYLPSTGRVPLLGAAGVHIIPVTINRVPGHFVLDTGAAYVSITSEFAAKAGIVKFENRLLKTVGGTVRADVGYANSITVDRAEAEGVVVAVIPSGTNPFPEHTDGLLGMSFLARFRIDLSQNGLTLTPIRARTRSFI